MKTTLLSIIILVTTITLAQNPREVKIGEFNTIKVYDLITVNLVKSTENKIIISGRDAGDVELVNKNGILKVRMAFDRQFDGTETFVHVHYTTLKTIDGNEGAVITSNELIEQPQLEIRVQEGARVKAGVKVAYLDIRAVTGGITEISGTVDQQNITVNTGGIIENQELITKRSNVKVRAGGEVEVYAIDSVDIDIKAGGEVMVYGNPKDVTQKTFAGGSIVIRD